MEIQLGLGLDLDLDRGRDFATVTSLLQKSWLQIELHPLKLIRSTQQPEQSRFRPFFF